MLQQSDESEIGIFAQEGTKRQLSRCQEEHSHELKALSFSTIPQESDILNVILRFAFQGLHCHARMVCHV